MKIKSIHPKSEALVKNFSSSIVYCTGRPHTVKCRIW
uniref:Uncharacterized protein n=1 Tax=Anguilla anguilla TaxID=7936 RepID=A0A0E9X0X1_ANGAN